MTTGRSFLLAGRSLRLQSRRFLSISRSLRANGEQLAQSPTHTASTSFSAEKASTSINTSDAREGSSIFKPVPTGPKNSETNTTSDGSQMSIERAHAVINGGNSIWLRDVCRCARCVDPSTSQKLFQTSDIPPNITIKSVTAHGTGVDITWQNDVPGFDEAHVTHVDSNMLRFLGRPGPSAELRADHGSMASVWDAAKIRKELRFLDWQSVLHDDGSLLTLLNSLHKYGLVFLKSIPKEEVNGPQKLADRIGRIRNTFYGPTWDVKSVPNAKNIAYTNVFLGFHMDLLYMTDPPRFQMLQCIHNSCEGGASMFSDSYKAVHEMQKKQKGQYRLLTSFPVTFHYHNAGEHYRLSHPTIETGRDGKLQAVNYSPPFQAPFDISGPDQKRDFKDFHKALKSFQNVVEDESNIYEYKMGEGDMVLFDNRRVLHARRSFDVNSGSRWLKGGYMDADVVDSKHRMLMEAEMMK